MPTRIRVPNRIAHHIPIPIPRQRIIHPRHNRIRRDEIGRQRVVESCSIIIQLQPCLEALAGVEAVGEQRAATRNDRAIRTVQNAIDLIAAVIRDQAGGTEMVAVDVVYLTVDAGGNSLAGGKVVVLDRRKLLRRKRDG